jgi:hypothetical protein
VLATKQSEVAIFPPRVFAKATAVSIALKWVRLSAFGGSASGRKLNRLRLTQGDYVCNLFHFSTFRHRRICRLVAPKFDAGGRQITH